MKLPSIDEAQIAGLTIVENVEPKLSVQEQAFFIAGFIECMKWLSSNDLETPNH